MKKYVLTCVFDITCALVCFVGCKNGVKGHTPNKKPEPEKVYKIGDEGAGGGIVFYVNEEGFKVYDGKGGEQVYHYLEMSKNSLGMSMWISEYSDIGIKDRGIGYGKANTYKILSTAPSESLTEDKCAAYRASKYFTTKTKVGDWWLPAKDELDLMYKNQKDTVIATCIDRWHWSSSEFDQYESWNKYFGNNNWNTTATKTHKYSVRAVRAF